MSETKNVLHLSDLHFGMELSDETPQTVLDRRNLTLNSLIDTLKKIPKEWHPQIVAISGDIGWKGNKRDYLEAKKWLLEKLLPILKLSPKKLVICPGNHDLDRKETIGSLPPPSYVEADEWLKIEHIKKFSTPFDEFVSFCNDIGMRALEIGNQTGNLVGKIDIDGLRFVVLNSSWFCRGDNDRNKLWLGKPLIEKMAVHKQLTKKDNNTHNSQITIVLFHHPEDWLNEKESGTYGNRQNTLEYLAFRSHIILNGHIHARPAEPHLLFNQVWLVKGGASYINYQYQNNFSIIKINLENYTFKRLTFEFDAGLDLWRKIPEDKEPPSYDFIAPQSPKTSTRLSIPEKYMEWVNAQCRDMDITKLAEATSIIQVSLPEIYIPLYAKSYEISIEKPIDIEKLIEQKRSMVISGRAGSGKTTLAKHFTYMMIKEQELKGATSYLPVLVFLKDLKEYDGTGLTGNSEMAEKIFDYWCTQTDSFLDKNIILSFCEIGNIIIFLDGLDEIDEPLREFVTESFHRFQLKYEKCKVILLGRPHGIDNSVIKWFGPPVEILPLVMDQIEQFIHKWFQIIYESERSGFSKTAQDMVSEIRSHSSVDELLDSPLMLTAICLLCNDNNALPGQRAELYDRFITNLLYKRFRSEDQKVRNFLVDLALEMQVKKRSKFIDNLEAITILGRQYNRKDGESVTIYNKRLNDTFDYVEPGCGILKLEKNGYGFINHTFQEFLAANGFVATTTDDYFRTINKYLYDDWYREVIELFIGYLSIKSPGMANSIVRKILAEKNDGKFHKKILAIQSFADIHNDKQDHEVRQSAIHCLEEIIGSKAQPIMKAKAGELLGRIGDPRDLEQFILIPDGTYETELGNVKLNKLWVSKYPVTNRWYKGFIKNEGYTNKQFWSQEGRKWLEREKAIYPQFWFDYRWNCNNTPVVGISWYEADAFCRWLTILRQDHFNYRLADEKEWEAIAAGKERFKYPLGNDFDINRCNINESKIGKTSAVGIFLDGCTFDGLSDMVGNVWEWTCSSIEDSMKKLDFQKNEGVMIRGGSWDIFKEKSNCITRIVNYPSERSKSIGFRCVRHND